jgi:NADPH:quinone reductase-like Zn-dependent oxidoreductase
MAAVLLTGHGGLDRLEYRTDVPVPRPEEGEVLIQVAAAGINNTDVNTRIGWYSKVVTSGTGEGGAAAFDAIDDVDATWSGKALEFPRVQGADVCGRIVDGGEGVSPQPHRRARPGAEHAAYARRLPALRVLDLRQ